MSTLVVVLRATSLLAFAGPMLIIGATRLREATPTVERRSTNWAPVVANFLAFGLFFVSLALFSGNRTASIALPMALMGCLVTFAGSILLIRARIALGAAWSLAAKANKGTGLVIAGPYRLVRHPIYLGFSMLALGQAFAFANWPALLIVVCAVVPTFVWRAIEEENLLGQTFGENYAIYQRRTKSIIPYLL